MAFDTDTRNKLAKLVADARSLLRKDFTEQLQEVYGIQPDGKMAPLETLTDLDDYQRETANTLRQRVAHLASGIQTEKKPIVAAVDRMTREQSFTILNRFAALRMCEERGLLQQCVGNGMNAKGFQVYLQTAGSALGGQYERYRAFLFCVFDEIAVDLGILFDRFSAFGLLFPRETALIGLIEIVNREALQRIWVEDEAIGWIYQYFNTAEERRAMRNASQAPRNSRELAVRNQFFTPRYVVEFLTDNTLGRIWYEMRKGNTVLKDTCQYLVRRPSEVFLQIGQIDAVGEGVHSDLSQEELLKQPIYIEHRPQKNPCDLHILDPACGSGHFLLYAFDLLERIYEEAWSDPNTPKSEVTGRTLQEHFETRDDLRREIPKLIIEHNLHGIDIDPRAVQVATLALWLRAQKTWQALGISGTDRPKMAKSNIVTAEPMPGEEDLQEEFSASLKPRVIGQLVDTVFEKMKLAGEAGPLLKIEEEIRYAVSKAKAQWLKGPKPEQQPLFHEMDDQRPKQQELLFDFEGVTDEEFWEQAEDRILDALKVYSEKMENGRTVIRRLFAEDAARGFAFINLCKKRYDVALMNPPFGEPSIQTVDYLSSTYPDSRADIDAVFVDRVSSLLLRLGMLGGIYNRTQFFKGYLQNWRDRNILVNRNLSACLDLGLGVLDGAMVEAAAYTTSATANNQPAIFITALAHVDKEQAVLDAYSTIMSPYFSPQVNVVYPRAFLELPGHRISYWVAKRLFEAFKKHKPLEGQFGYARQGLITSDNDRFLRLIWEVPSHCLGRSKSDCTLFNKKKGRYPQQWIPYAKGGDYSPYFGDIHLAVNWGGAGKEICSFFKNGRLASRPQNTGFYFKRALTYTERTASDFSPRVMPDGCIFDCKGPIIAATKNELLFGLLSLANSKVFKYFIELFLAGGDSSVSVGAARQFTQSIVGSVPIPKNFVEQNTELGAIAQKIWYLFSTIDETDETSQFFAQLLTGPLNIHQSLRDALSQMEHTRDSQILKILELTDRSEELVFSLYGLDEKSWQEIADFCGEHPNRFKDNSFLKLDNDEQIEILSSSVDEIIAKLRERGHVKRSITKMSYYADRWLEVLCNAYHTRPDVIINQKWNLNVLNQTYFFNGTAQLISFLLGCIFGRWDIRITLNPSLVPKLREPFEPLPICSPYMLVGIDSLPAKTNGIVSEEWLIARPNMDTLPPEGAVTNPTISDCEYPLRIAWNGILVDDPGFNSAQAHQDDIVRRIREVLDLLWKGKAHDIEQEVCDILGVSNICDYFQKQTKFFQDHLKHYSKSRRKAPIYWPLSTPSGSYTLWIYYHSLTDQTLYACVTDYIEPKIKEVSDEIAGIQKDLGEGGNTNLRGQLERLIDFQQELIEFRNELLLVAQLPYKPNLNDGVLITAAPLWKLFQLKSWQKELKNCWNKLTAGDYDWAHLAYSIWPDRVRKACKTDRSIAIAHGLEEICEVTEPQKGKKRKRR